MQLVQNLLQLPQFRLQFPQKLDIAGAANLGLQFRKPAFDEAFEKHLKAMTGMGAVGRDGYVRRSMVSDRR